MEFAYPIIVFFVEDKFHSYVPSSEDYLGFAQNYIQVTGLSFDNVEVFLYHRKDWIAMLQASNVAGTAMTIEKNSVVNTRTVKVPDIIEVKVDWMKEDGLEEFYSAAEIVQIEENKAQLLNCTMITQEVIAGLPHVIPTKFVTVEGFKEVQEVTEILGTSFTVPEPEVSVELEIEE